MKTVILIVIALILPPMSTIGQEVRRDRHPAVAGSFYPAGEEKLKSELKVFFGTCKGPDSNSKVRALIAPHAGYVYSGHTAAAAFAAIDPESEYDNIFLIGSSHRFAFEGAAVFVSGNMITPLGAVTVNTTIGNDLLKENKWFFKKDEAHIPEHSLEVELPFIQYHFRKQIPVIPLLIGTRNTSTLKEIARTLKPYFSEKNLFVISSDFSHYPSYYDAIEADKRVADAIKSGKPEVFLNTIRSVEAAGTEGLRTAMCGWPGGLVLLYLTEDNSDITYRLVEYTNSGDSPSGSRDEVVGYNAIVAESKASDTTSERETDSFTLTEEEKKRLLGIARSTINERVNGLKPEPVDKAKLTSRMKEPLGAFVTITIDGNLRGCIGRFTSTDPLYMVVSAMALEAAFGDPRFPDLTAREYPDIEIEISVLGPMKKISDIKEIIIGKHGIYIKKGLMAGTLLPQVASERHWSVTEFLGYCARDKAGLGWDGWKNAEIFIYEAFVFGE